MLGGIYILLGKATFGNPVDTYTAAIMSVSTGDAGIERAEQMGSITFFVLIVNALILIKIGIAYWCLHIYNRRLFRMIQFEMDIKCNYDKAKELYEEGYEDVLDLYEVVWVFHPSQIGDKDWWDESSLKIKEIRESSLKNFWGNESNDDVLKRLYED